MKVIVAVAESRVRPEAVVARFGMKPEDVRVIDMGKEKLMLFSLGDTVRLDTIELLSMEGMKKVYSFVKPYKLIHKELKPRNFSVKIKGKPLFGAGLKLIAGFTCRCTREDRNILKKTRRLSQRGIDSFYFRITDTRKADLAMIKELLSGIKEKGFNIFITLPSPDVIEYLKEIADVFVVEKSNMQDFALLREAGKSKIPLMVRKSPWATLDEFILAAEYVVCEGNANVILCVGGVFTADQKVVPDIISLMSLKEQTYLPIVMEVGANYSERYIPYLAKFAKDIDCDGILLENYHVIGDICCLPGK
ncbi:MAG: hypothetical protein DRP91_09125 [Candidatus Neomarinimicrobiota bacterium]|nr:MAG: hypothetical protein DRP91_09125 [Candidatus Neomarinimicrobiota bacterium]